ncbi:MAG: formate dehydrogenase accessory sulfurtransferase FdhD [Candidatus Omnitrophica bacterium]|nr:formate dehydrogenase accessory sulfurtransferase FdhD [Candidatus Omnitrophota bacterium]MBU1127818.1 formate dehydrogenase accessory sulfurtransferase FdhD [Candidatus Omnitrophota bacterium]MBU1656844.1 formate dehydrogenase accessory sulfurtransferase FdhD [Candidatus Omnitrophota bacterium]MBU1784554.1 formate dehydrogenase accessory sulfurtransferase FdhD [Candidatus Omnitrophota bacterium]MBU1851142.1 formate dehydrogenase accessory sulfurtransferase FdhD [Candidatus Omnitrophota bact
MEQIEIIKINKGIKEVVKDVVAEEVPVTIYVNGDEIVTLLSSPEGLEELAVGFLFTAGLLDAADEISGIFVDDQNWTVEVLIKDKKIDSCLLFKRVFTSGCGGGTFFYKASDTTRENRRFLNMTVRKEHIFRIMENFQKQSKGFRETGCVHSAALADNEDILVVREDIGRHNAIDKVLGYAFINDMELKDKIMLTSGRISSEVLLKMRKTDISMIVSRSAPTNQAVKHAELAGITLIGFVRGNRMNLYSAKNGNVIK